MEGENIKVIVRQSSGDQFEVELSAKAPITDLKAACAAKQTNIAANEMRLIFKGKILKDEMTLDEYKITDGLTVHMVKGKSANPLGASAGAATTTQPAAAGSSLGGAAGMAN